MVAHLGVVTGGWPMVIPTVYGFDAQALYLHGSVASQSLNTAGTPVCVTITLTDALVLARSVFEHTINYRSAVIYGRPRLVNGRAEKLAALRCITEHIAPGQWDYARQPSRKELAAARVLALPLDEASVAPMPARAHGRPARPPSQERTSPPSCPRLTKLCTPRSIRKAASLANRAVRSAGCQGQTRSRNRSQSSSPRLPTAGRDFRRSATSRPGTGSPARPVYLGHHIRSPVDHAAFCRPAAAALGLPGKVLRGAICATGRARLAGA
jgi:nitroimidazol reductase NimA-like FMN-containing flavoprotein (pyridoxamine 5'-phosphate oxidase superfamily)